MAEEETQ